MINQSVAKVKKLINDWQKKLVNGNRYLLTGAERHLVKDRLKPLLAEIFGYHALLYSNKAKELVGDSIVTRHRFVMQDASEENSPKYVPNFHCRFTELPISSDSIDLIVIPEVLQSNNYPHQVLREAERVLIPEGQIVLLVENVFGWQSIKNRLIAFIAEPHFKTRVITRSRIKDWFNLLGLEVLNEFPIVSFENNSPVRESNWKTKVMNIKRVFSSSYYILVAKKKVSTLTPIRPSWRSNRKLVRPRIAEPSVKGVVEKILNQSFSRIVD